ncbi:hypothetical protein [Kaistia nematophila]|uniref:Uncharacterized protein n=1 Tax=Kaistia nematophila TaxID=2994654 RepID=A0A9X3E0U6_9HYPH|nr:hypothetical protein [Kaistia nematophila]MCX5569589.1 hypothetical protein [Kaistia nematophila]
MTSKRALISTRSPEAIISVFPSTEGRIDLPGVGQLSPPEAGWSGDGYRIAGIVPAEIPAGKQLVSGGIDGIELIDGVPTWKMEDAPPPPRRMIRKSLVKQRLIDLGLMDAAYAALTSQPVAFARWFDMDYPEVYADDPDALALLDSIGADPEVVMAP